MIGHRHVMLGKNKQLFVQNLSSLSLVSDVPTGMVDSVAGNNATYANGPCFKGGNLAEFTMNVLTTDTITAATGSAIPTCSVDGTLNFVDNLLYLDIRVTRGGLLISRLPLSEKIITPLIHTYHDVSDIAGIPNSNHAQLVNGSLANNETVTKLDGEYSQLGCSEYKFIQTNSSNGLVATPGLGSVSGSPATLSAWVRVDSDINCCLIGTLSGSFISTYGCGFAYYNNKIYAHTNRNNVGYKSQPINVSIGRWIHLAISHSNLEYDNTNFSGYPFTSDVRVYVNGILFEERINQSCNNYVYTWQFLNGIAGSPFNNVSMFDVRMYESELSSEDILNIKQGLATGVPLRWYKCDEDTGTTVFDYSANQVNSSVVGPEYTRESQQTPALASDITLDALGNPITNPQGGFFFLNIDVKIKNADVAALKAKDIYNVWYDTFGVPKEATFTELETAIATYPEIYGGDVIAGQSIKNITLK